MKLFLFLIFKIKMQAAMGLCFSHNTARVANALSTRYSSERNITTADYNLRTQILEASYRKPLGTPSVSSRGTIRTTDGTSNVNTNANVSRISTHTGDRASITSSTRERRGSYVPSTTTDGSVRRYSQRRMSHVIGSQNAVAEAVQTLSRCK